MMAFYLASRYDRAAEIEGYAQQLRALGEEVVSRWHNVGQGDSLLQGAIRDLRDMECADVMIQFTGGGHSHGRHAELGWAMRDGMYVAFVGEPEGVYHALPMWAWWSDWPTLLEDIRNMDIHRQLHWAGVGPADGLMYRDAGKGWRPK